MMKTLREFLYHTDNLPSITQKIDYLKREIYILNIEKEELMVWLTDHEREYMYHSNKDYKDVIHSEYEIGMGFISDYDNVQKQTEQIPNLIYQIGTWVKELQNVSQEVSTLDVTIPTHTDLNETHIDLTDSNKRNSQIQYDESDYKEFGHNKNDKFNWICNLNKLIYIIKLIQIENELISNESNSSQIAEVIFKHFLFRDQLVKIKYFQTTFENTLLSNKKIIRRFDVEKGKKLVELIIKNKSLSF